MRRQVVLLDRVDVRLFNFYMYYNQLISEKPNGCKGGYNVCYKINYSSDQGRIYPCSDQVYDALFLYSLYELT